MFVWLLNIDPGCYDYLKHAFLKNENFIDVDDVVLNYLVLKFKAFAKEFFCLYSFLIRLKFTDIILFLFGIIDMVSWQYQFL